jgi:dihydrofolate synthase/folylpolyglutamate synthase
VKNKADTLLKELYSLRQFPKKMSLENITTLCEFLNHPQKKYPTIHLAGTNGKGSTAFLIYRIVKAHGLKTGLYTSPHLKEFNERVRINDRFIPNDYMAGFWQKIKSIVYKINATFFDTTTALAFEYFANQKVDLAIIETGLGGRLDATNIVQPAAAVITPIDYDHMKHLGNDILSIAKEKAAIIKEGSRVFSSGQQEAVHNLLQQYALVNFVTDAVETHNVQIKKHDSMFTLYDKIREVVIEDLNFSLAGRHQLENLTLAYQVSRWYLETSNIKFNLDAFKKIIGTCVWPGRLQCISRSPEIIVDVCHNIDGFRRIADHINRTYTGEKLHLLFGLIADKAFYEILEIISRLFASITITEPIHHHPIPGKQLQSELALIGTKAFFIKDIKQAFEFCKKRLDENEILFILGSHYLIGNLRRL